MWNKKYRPKVLFCFSFLLFFPRLLEDEISRTSQSTCMIGTRSPSHFSTTLTRWRMRSPRLLPFHLRLPKRETYRSPWSTVAPKTRSLAISPPRHAEGQDVLIFSVAQQHQQTRLPRLFPIRFHHVTWSPQIVVQIARILTSKVEPPN